MVLGGIYAGMFTPTEAAADQRRLCVRHRGVRLSSDLKLSDVPRVLLASANMSAMILYIITNAVLFSFLMTSEQIPQAMTAWITSMRLGWIEFLLFVNVLLLLAGNVMEPSSIVLITAPILFPVAVKLGVHPVHLGILMTVNMEVGMCHPPVGLNLYVASGIAKMGITELTIAVWPWLLTMLGFLVLVTYCAGAVALAAAHAWACCRLRLALAQPGPFEVRHAAPACPSAIARGGARSSSAPVAVIAALGQQRRLVDAAPAREHVAAAAEGAGGETRARQDCAASAP